MKLQGIRKRGRPKRRWLDKVKVDIKDKGLSADDVYDRATWRRIVHRPHIRVGIRFFLKIFNKIAIQGTSQMAVD